MLKKLLLALLMVLLMSAVASAEHGSGAGGITPDQHGPILWGPE